MKKTIIHVIYDLNRGGAEMMLVKVLKELKEYTNIVVTIRAGNHFEGELECEKLYCLNLKSIILFPAGVIQLRRLIKKYKPSIVHTHLFWPTVIGRLATPSGISLITTIHAFIATAVEYKIWYIKFLDKLTFKVRKSVIIAVAKGARDQYFNFLNLKPFRSYSLYTFVDPREFDYSRLVTVQRDTTNFKLITVGALRLQKNHRYLLEAFALLKDQPFELDIYGDGPLRDELQQIISDRNLNVTLKGEVKNIAEIITGYDLFTMSSTFEGFSLGVLEAMAMKIPLLISDIESFREQCEDTAEYFSLDNVDDFVLKLKTLSADKNRLVELSANGKDRVLQNFTLEKHMSGLRKIYSENS